jgi:Protein of unknown function (DUF4232)
MARSTLKPRKALWALIAAMAVTVLTAAPVSARPAISASAASGRPAASPSSEPAACQPADLGISVPAAITGDPAEGMGKQAWNVVFRNTARTACSLRGWPSMVVRTPAGKTVTTTVSDVTFSNLALVPEAVIVLRPGQSAIVTATSATAPAGCVTTWVLGLTLPGTGRSVTVREPAGSFVPCVGGRLRLSPFYAEQTLTRDIKAMAVSAAPPPFPADTAAEPPVCSAASLRADITSAVSQGGGSIIEIRLGNDGPACVLPVGWPTVRLNEAGGSGQVAKIFPDAAAAQAEKSLLSTYEQGTAQSTALTLRPGGSVSFALFAAATGTRACQRATSVTVYPSAAAGGAGRTAALATPVSICGPPKVLPFLPARPGGMALAVARNALAAAKTDPVRQMPGSDSAGFFYGTDSSLPTACGSGNGPFTEPIGDCSHGSAGPYGEYIGETGSFMNWQGCTTSGLAWNQANYNMATDNLVDHGTGLGAAAYWFAAGPGRDPHYNGSASEATTWGQQQAEAALSDLNGRVFGFRYIFMDIENNGSPPDWDGWNTRWNGACGDKVKASYIPANIDYATWQGFADYINAHSPYLAGVYSAGGYGYGGWIGIFGGEQLTNAAEWTFDDEQSQLKLPRGFSGSAASALWFANAPAACHLLWQWSGGDGVLNGYGDLDQAEAANDANPACTARPATSSVTHPRPATSSATHPRPATSSATHPRPATSSATHPGHGKSRT